MQSQDYIHDQIQEHLQEKEEENAKLREEMRVLREVQHDVYYVEGQIEALTSENLRLRQEKKEAEAEREMWKKRCKVAEASNRRRIG
jgi:predicted nuclease with TOPRIM domain